MSEPSSRQTVVRIGSRASRLAQAQARQMQAAIAATPEREDVRDAFLSNTFEHLEDLPHGARLGAASLRRQTRALYRRPDLEPVLPRGNIDTRLAKPDRGEAGERLHLPV